MFIPVPHTQIEGADATTGWSRFALVGAPETGTWFIASVVVGRDLSCHTMLFADAHLMVEIMNGPEYKKIVTLVMVAIKSLQIETHRIRRMWASGETSEPYLIAESADGAYLTCSTGHWTPLKSGFEVALDIPNQDFS